MADPLPVVVRTADFIREFQKLAPHRHRYEVFRDFVHMSAFSLANAWPYTRSEAIETEFESIKALQSIAQLSARYGRDYAQSIQGGFNTAIAYAGSDPETAMYFEKLTGKTRVYQYHDPTAGSGHRTATSHHETYREQNLMNAGEIRTMPSDAVLTVSGNQQPALIPSKGYFEVGRLRRATSLAPVPVEVGRARGMEWVEL